MHKYYLLTFIIFTNYVVSWKINYLKPPNKKKYTWHRAQDRCGYGVTRSLVSTRAGVMHTDQMCSKSVAPCCITPTKQKMTHQSVSCFLALEDLIFLLQGLMNVVPLTIAMHCSYPLLFSQLSVWLFFFFCPPEIVVFFLTEN